MELINLNDTCTKSRREVLITLDEILSEGDLNSVVGQSPVLDLALLAMTEGNTELRDKLSTALDVEQLQEDVKHVRDSAVLREKKREVFKCVTSTTKL